VDVGAVFLLVDAGVEVFVDAQGGAADRAEAFSLAGETVGAACYVKEALVALGGREDFGADGFAVLKEGGADGTDARLAALAFTEGFRGRPEACFLARSFPPAAGSAGVAAR
jgi:hypothetical protein